MSDLYDNPRYYEIAFSFRDIPAEVDLLEECFRRFARIPVRSVLELGCGNSPHLEEFVARGYRYSGLDLSEAMLEYGKRKALRIGAEVNLVERDMADFAIEEKVDFVYVMLGSLSVKDTPSLKTHFDSVARALNEGGLYFLDWCVQYDPPWQSEGGGSWEMEREGVKVRATVGWKAVSRVEQTFEETILLEVDDRGNQIKIAGKEVKRAIYPQEFLCFVAHHEEFEFVGWWNNWDLAQPVEKATKIDRPITLLRRV
jgi:SAM-dependent methyltransferase